MGAEFIPSYRAAQSPLPAAVERGGEVQVGRAEPIERPRVEPALRPAPPDSGPRSDVRVVSARAEAPRESVEGSQAARVVRDRGEVQGQLDALRARYEADAPHARFETQFNNIVWGEGDPCARLLFVGEAPGEDEDRTGRPFVGRAGQLLEKMIVAMGLSRESVYICNVLKTRPPGNRPPTPEETQACAPYLYQQIATVAPEVIVTLGRPATHLLLGTQDAMGRLRGVWAEFAVPPGRGGVGAVESTGVRFPVMPTYHPSYVLRSYTEENRKAVWSDLKQVLDRLGLKPPGSGAGTGAGAGVRAG